MNHDPASEQQIGNVALLVENYDDAIGFYTQKLGFDLVEEYGTVAVFRDLYGNKWDLLQLNR